MKAYIVGFANDEYIGLMRMLGFEITKRPSEASIALFTGGEDVNPRLYGARAHKTTHFNEARDSDEAFWFTEFAKRDIPMLGICRGGQFLNVMNGGAMYQHVSDHTRDHVIMDVLSQKTILASSTHHQMMKPAKNGLLVAYSMLMGTREWYEGQTFHNDIAQEDVEVVYYAETKCLCFQPHPEFTGARYHELKLYLDELLQRFEMKVEALV